MTIGLLSTSACAIPAGAIAKPAAVETRTVTTAAALVALLNSSYQGVIDIPAGTRINMAGYQNTRIKDGVTLRSDRGGTRPGALIYTTDLNRRYDLFVVEGSHVRIEGLRIKGPSASEDQSHSVTGIRVRAAYPEGRSPTGISRDVVIRGNELWAWPGSAVSVAGAINYADCFKDLPDEEQADANTPRPWHVMSKTQAWEIAVVGNHIHHNLRNRLGYGVVVGGGAYALIQANTFEYNRHAIASSGRPYSGYVARDNYALQQTNFQSGKGPFGSWPTHFDMHGCGENGDGGDGGEYVQIAYNTFRGEQEITLGFGVRKAFRIRGVPRDSAWFVENVLVHDDFGEAIDYYGSGDRVYVEGNDFDVDQSLEIAAGDFDADGLDDVFHATGAGWWFSSAGVASWEFLTRSERTFSEVALGDFDGDGFADVFDRNKGRWRYFSGRERSFKHALGSSGVVLAALRFGDFDGNGRTDVLWADGENWRVKWDARGEWDVINSSSHRSRDVRLCDFDGDGRSDVFGLRDGGWFFSSGGRARWARLNDDLASLDDVVHGDFDGDGRCDVAFQKGRVWRFASGGRGSALRLRGTDDGNFSIATGTVGRFALRTRDSFLRFPRIWAPRKPPRIGLNFVRWTYGALSGDAFVAHSRQNMR